MAAAGQKGRECVICCREQGFEGRELGVCIAECNKGVGVCIDTSSARASE